MLPMKERFTLKFKQAPKPSCLELECCPYLFNQNQSHLLCVM